MLGDIIMPILKYLKKMSSFSDSFLLLKTNFHMLKKVFFFIFEKICSITDFFLLKANVVTSAGEPDAGQVHYDNLCMKAVNQSIGRAIRHKG